MNRFIGLDGHPSSCTVAVLSEKGKTIRTDEVRQRLPGRAGRRRCETYGQFDPPGGPGQESTRRGGGHQRLTVFPRARFQSPWSTATLTITT